MSKLWYFLINFFVIAVAEGMQDYTYIKTYTKDVDVPTVITPSNTVFHATIPANSQEILSQAPMNDVIPKGVLFDPPIPHNSAIFASTISNYEQLSQHIYFIAKDCVIPAIKPNMAKDVIMQQIKKSGKQYDIATLHHYMVQELQKLQEAPLTDVVLDRAHLYKISRRLSFIFKYINNPVFQKLLAMHKSSCFQDAKKSYYQLHAALGSKIEHSINIDGKPVAIDSSKVLHIGQRILGNYKEYQQERHHYATIVRDTVFPARETVFKAELVSLVQAPLQEQCAQLCDIVQNQDVATADTYQAYISSIIQKIYEVTPQKSDGIPELTDSFIAGFKEGFDPIGFIKSIPELAIDISKGLYAIVEYHMTRSEAQKEQDIVDFFRSHSQMIPELKQYVATMKQEEVLKAIGYIAGQVASAKAVHGSVQLAVESAKNLALVDKVKNSQSHIANVIEQFKGNFYNPQGKLQLQTAEGIPLLAAPQKVEGLVHLQENTFKPKLPKTAPLKDRVSKVLVNTQKIKKQPPIKVISDEAIRELSKISQLPDKEIIHNVVNKIKNINSKEVLKLSKKFDNTRKGFAEFAHKYIKIPYEHILAPDIKIFQDGNIKFNGFHHDLGGIIEKKGLIKFANVVKKGHGFYQADVAFNGIVRTEKTFFPQHWSREKIISKIFEAYDNFIASGIKPKLTPNGKYEITGRIREGYDILIHITKSGEITSAYPILATFKKPI